jgi:hypothetical protein
VCLPVVNDLFLLVFGLVETIEDLASCSLENLEVYWDTLSRLHIPRNLHVAFYSWHKSVLVFKPVKKIWTSERVS